MTEFKLEVGQRTSVRLAKQLTKEAPFSAKDARAIANGAKEVDCYDAIISEIKTRATLGKNHIWCHTNTLFRFFHNVVPCAVVEKLRSDGFSVVESYTLDGEFSLLISISW